MTRLTFTFLLIFCTKITISQNLTADKNLTQNLLLHLSKNTCNAGEVVAFKCYVINNINHIEDDHNLYILLTDKKGTILSKEKYPLFNSSANGFITIPKELEAGCYFIQAFTPYMVNNKIIKSSPLMVNTLQSGVYDLPILCNIFYDNNKLISNIPNTFFIKTAFSNGLPATCDVTLTDKDDKQLKGFTTDNNGVAKITFTPLKNQQYKLSINNKKFLYPLVKPDSNGVNMLVSFEKNVLNFMLTKNYKIQPKEDSFTVVVYQNNSEVYKAAFSFENYASITSGVNISTLPTGIVRLVLQDNDRNVVSATSIYLKNDKNFEDIDVEITPNLEKNILNGSLTFSNKVNRFLSVSIDKIDRTDSIISSNLDFFYASTQENEQGDKIVDFFEIANSIKKADHSIYKIISPNVRVQQRDTRVNNVVIKINNDYATIIRGKTYEPNGEKLITSGMLQFSFDTPDSTYKYSTKIKSDGSFILDSLLFSGKQKFKYTYFNTNNKEVGCTIKLIENREDEWIDSLLVYGYDFRIKPKTILTQLVKDSNNEAEKITTNTPEKSKEKQKKSKPIDYATGIYSGTSSATIDNYTTPIKDGVMNGGDFVKNRIPNLAFQNGNIVNTKNFTLLTQIYWSIGIVIDEAPVALSDLNLLNSKDIAFIKFFEPGHVSVSSANPGGIIAVYTKSRVDQLAYEKVPFATNVPITKEKQQVFEYEGFTDQAIISIRNKSVLNPTFSTYWNPSIIINKEQPNFTFETEKIEAGKQYNLTIRGYNELGKIINVERRIN